jgi:hypothetical protein
MNKQNKKTMKKNYIYSLAATFITAALAMGGLTACSNEDLVAEKQNATQAQTYTVSIPATIGGEADTRAVTFDGITSTSTFSTSELVYVYNKTKNAMLHGYLSPANLRNGDKVCDLNGTLTGTIEGNDRLVLFYNQNGTFYTDDPLSNYYEYDNQNGVTPLDGATAEVVVSDYSGGVLTTTTTASFTNVQSMFRLKFTDGSNDISVKRLNIKSKNSAIASFFRPLYAVDYQYTYSGGVTVSPASATSDYLYVALCINEALANGDELTFIVLSDNNKLYEGTKAAPSGGFMNGKYYYNTTPITLAQSVRIMPTFTGASAEPNEYFTYTINDDPTNITISGVSKGYKFRLNKPATVTLDNVYAEYDNENFIYGNGGDLTVNLIGTNTLKCNWSSCIAADRYHYNLKLTGNGTLTVSVSPYSSQPCGLDGMNYTTALNDNTTTGECDVSSQLALDPAKTTVIRSARSGNYSAGWTWTYTVTTNN